MTDTKGNFPYFLPLSIIFTASFWYDHFIMLRDSLSIPRLFDKESPAQNTHATKQVAPFYQMPFHIF